MKTQTSKCGFTLMELMVYIAILGIVVLIAGQAFTDSTRFRIRTQNMLKATQVAENIGTLFKSDVAQMGAKSSKERNTSANTDSFYVDAIHDVFIDPDNLDSAKRDSSSYAITHDNGGTGLDSLTLLRMRYKETGEFLSVEKVAWYVNGTTLKRSCQTIKGTALADECPKDTPLEVEMAENIQKFVVTPATPSVVSDMAQILPSTSSSIQAFRLVPRYGEENLSFVTTIPAEGGESVSLNGFATNYDYENNEPLLDQKNANQVFVAESNGNIGNWKDLCIKVTLVPNVEYEISFAMPISEDAGRMFCPGRDHMAVGFRYANDGTKPAEIDDFLFYPPTIAGAAEGNRSMRFTVKDSIKDVCLGFTFASYSPIAASGKMTLKNVSLKKNESAIYEFDDLENINVLDKKNVKAMRLVLVVNQRGETGVDSLVVPVPSNGPRD